MALLCLLGLAGEKLRVISTVFGNFTVEEATENITNLLNIAPCGCTPLVAKGSHSPQQRVLQKRKPYHGKESVADFCFPKRTNDLCGVCTGLHELARVVVERGIDTVVVCGPLTNIGALYAENSDLPIKHTIVSGGCFSAEAGTGVNSDFNLAADPEAAQVIFSQGIHTVLVPFKVSSQCFFEPPDMSQVGFGEPLFSTFLKQLSVFSFRLARERFGCERFFLHDAMCALVAMEPELAECDHMRVSVILSGPDQGMLRQDLDEALLSVCKKINITRCKALLIDILRRLNHNDSRRNS